MRKYRLIFENYNDNYRLISNCNAMTFINNGTATLYVNNFPIAAGASLATEGNENEEDVTEYNINFGGTLGDLWVIKKIYL